ncbi:MAG: hypothetical protein LH647_07000 [Leptolyngbyaceae cyanobacterium CAN_BIN12]|nr:hypothetical protein [Leptolyngbyaceae cyanobacterium CAN_BIN12]
MQFEFVPVEEFYFALTLAVKTLEELTTPGLAETVGSCLKQKYGQSSTVAAATQNTYSYVFKVKDIDNSPNSGLIVTIADWQGNVRISSDYGWVLDGERKPIRTEKFDQRPEFARQLQEYIQEWLQVSLVEVQG